MTIGFGKEKEKLGGGLEFQEHAIGKEDLRGVLADCLKDWLRSQQTNYSGMFFFMYF